MKLLLLLMGLCAFNPAQAKKDKKVSNQEQTYEFTVLCRSEDNLDEDKIIFKKSFSTTQKIELAKVKGDKKIKVNGKQDNNLDNEILRKCKSIIGGKITEFSVDKFTKK